MGTIIDRPLRKWGRLLVRWLVVLSTLLMAPRTALAWGKLGHRVVSAVAEKRLHPAALRAVHELLEPGESLADASLWADDHRKDLAGSGAWHFVDVPIVESAYRSSFCPDSGCVVSKIEEQIRLLQGPPRSPPTAERRQALRLLIHLVEDLHQPLHVADRHDRGGNDLSVGFFGEETNLHRLWDEGLLQAYSPDESVWIGEIERVATSGRSSTWAKGSFEDWANESLAAGRDAYRSPTTGLPLSAGAILREAYFERALPVVRQRLAQAAVRLAAVLDKIFG